MTFEVDTPILNSPFEQPDRYWFLREGDEAQLRDGRRPAIVYPPRDGEMNWDLSDRVLQTSREFNPGYEMVLVNYVRQRLDDWRSQGYPGVTRTTHELLHYWQREGRERRLFYGIYILNSPRLKGGLFRGGILVCGNSSLTRQKQDLW